MYTRRKLPPGISQFEKLTATSSGDYMTILQHINTDVISRKLKLSVTLLIEHVCVLPYKFQTYICCYMTYFLGSKMSFIVARWEDL